MFPSRPLKSYILKGFICNSAAPGPLSAVMPVILHACRGKGWGWWGERSRRQTSSSLSIAHKKISGCVWLNDMRGKWGVKLKNLAEKRELEKQSNPPPPPFPPTNTRTYTLTHTDKHTHAHQHTRQPGSRNYRAARARNLLQKSVAEREVSFF